MASITLPSETAAGMVADALRQKIAAEIEQAIRERFDPFIKEICATKAREICDAAQVVMHRNEIDRYGSIDLHISFNGEKFDLASLVPSGATP
jgi:hypothetical protein